MPERICTLVSLIEKISAQNADFSDFADLVISKLSPDEGSSGQDETQYEPDIGLSLSDFGEIIKSVDSRNLGGLNKYVSILEKAHLDFVLFESSFIILSQGTFEENWSDLSLIDNIKNYSDSIIFFGDFRIKYNRAKEREVAETEMPDLLSEFLKYNKEGRKLLLANLEFQSELQKKRLEKSSSTKRSKSNLFWQGAGAVAAIGTVGVAILALPGMQRAGDSSPVPTSASAPRPAASSASR
jgi:hypothetical protein